MEQLTIQQGYVAMFRFLEELQEMTQSEDLAGFLGGMAFLQDGSTADPGAWKAWLTAVSKTLRDDNLPLLSLSR